MTNFVETADIPGLVGAELEPGEWMEITQNRVNDFADSTNDHQFIHVDLEKAKETPFGGTIAHGFLTLSLLTFLLSKNMVAPARTVITLNYGSDKVRFLNPVPVGGRIRAKQHLLAATEKKPGHWLLKINATVEIEGSDTPALVAEILFMHIVAG